MIRNPSPRGSIKERRKNTRLHSKATFINVLRITWVIAIVWCEIGAFFFSTRSCKWPTIPSVDSGAQTTHVLLMADPHVLDRWFYLASHPWLSSLTRMIINFNLRKSWNVASRLKPDAMFVLGDMLDNGRGSMTDNEYAEYYAFYNSTFTMPNGNPVFHVTGNHDVGLGSPRGFSGQARRRFKEHFGPEQQVVDVGNHSFVLLDAPGLVDEDYRRHSAEIDFEDWKGLKNGPIAFVHGFEDSPPPNPVILLSHIPLARSDGAPCGPDRERTKGIRRGAGFGYQNMLGKHTTNFIFQCIKPVIIFSGDDHDYCDYHHKKSGDPVREVSIRSFSMAMGVKRPGFHLLSLAPSSSVPYNSPTFADTECLLPQQVWLYTWIYFPLTVLTLGYLVYINLALQSRFGSQNLRSTKDLAPLRLSSTGGSSAPASPRFASRSQVSLRKTSLGIMSPHHSRPGTPILTPLDSPVLLSEVDDDNTVYDSPTTPHFLMPSIGANKFFTQDPDEDGEDGSVLPTHTLPTPRRRGSGWRQFTNDDGKLHWPTSLTEAVVMMRMLFRFCAHKAGRDGDGLAMKILKDVARTLWPPTLIALLICYRL